MIIFGRIIGIKDLSVTAEVFNISLHICRYTIKNVEWQENLLRRIIMSVRKMRKGFKWKMKKILYLLTILLMFAVLGCGASASVAPTKEAPQVKLKTAEEISTTLKAKGLLIGTVVVYTAETDPNKLLGRPNQYTGKVKFADASINQPEGKDPKGGSVEFFTNAADVKARKEYIDGIGKKLGPLFIEYSYINGTALLRLDSELTPDQAAQYEKIYMELKI